MPEQHDRPIEADSLFVRSVILRILSSSTNGCFVSYRQSDNNAFAKRGTTVPGDTVGVPVRQAVVCQSNMTALSGEASLFIPEYEGNSPVAPRDFDRLISR